MTIIYNMKFEDLTNAQLKKVIKNYRLHLLKELTGYTKMSREDLINLCKKLFDIDDEKIKPKITEPIFFDIPKGRQPKAEKKKKVVMPIEKKPEPKPQPTPKPEKTKKLSRKEKDELFLKQQQEKEEYLKNLMNTKYSGLIMPDSDDEDLNIIKKKSKTKKSAKQQKQTDLSTEGKPQSKPEPAQKQMITLPMPEPPKIKQNGILDELEKKRERVYTIMFKILSSPSKRSRQSINKELGFNKDDYELIKKIFEGKNAFDFIPTPLEFLKPMLESIKEREDTTFLEPSCGLGYVIHQVLKVNPKMQITAYEFNHEFMKILNMLFPKEHYPNITFHRRDFLEANDTGNYSTIFCNPPFTNNNDSRYYINFFFECNRIANNSKTDYYENLIFFISPPLYPDMKPNLGIDTSSILTSSYLTKKRIEDILNKEFSNKDYNELKKEKWQSEIYSELEDYEPVQIQFIGEVKFTAGTNYKAYSYLCLNKSK